MLSQSTPPAARGSEIYAGQNMKGAPTATRTRDLPLRRRSLYPLSYRGLRNPHATWDGSRSLPAPRRDPAGRHRPAREPATIRSTAPPSTRTAHRRRPAPATRRHDHPRQRSRASGPTRRRGPWHDRIWPGRRRKPPAQAVPEPDRRNLRYPFLWPRSRPALPLDRHHLPGTLDYQHACSSGTNRAGSAGVPMTLQ
jgi:hypothetical protein